MASLLLSMWVSRCNWIFVVVYVGVEMIWHPCCCLCGCRDVIGSLLLSMWVSRCYAIFVVVYVGVKMLFHLCCCLWVSRCYAIFVVVYVGVEMLWHLSYKKIIKLLEHNFSVLSFYLLAVFFQISIFVCLFLIYVQVLYMS